MDQQQTSPDVDDEGYERGLKTRQISMMAIGGELPRSGFRMPGAPWTGYFGLAFLALVVVLLGFSEDTRIALYVTPVVGVLIGVGYLVVRKRQAGPVAVGR